jgi:hypothetical protein
MGIDKMLSLWNDVDVIKRAFRVIGRQRSRIQSWLTRRQRPSHIFDDSIFTIQ